MFCVYISSLGSLIDLSPQFIIMTRIKQVILAFLALVVWLFEYLDK